MNENQQNQPNQQQNRQPNPNQQNPQQKKPKRPSIYPWVLTTIFAALIGLNFFGNRWEQRSFPIVEAELQEMVERRDVERIVIVHTTRDQPFAEVTIKPERIAADTLKYERLRTDDQARPRFFIYRFVTSVDVFHNQVRIWEEAVTEAEMEHLTADELANFRPPTGVSFDQVTRRGLFEGMGFLWTLLIIFIIFMLISRMMSGGMGGPGGGGGMGGIFNFGKSKAQLFDGKNGQVTFSDVAGLAEAKVEVMEIVDFLKNPKKYTDLGGKIPKGALLVGPPGTGKTLLAKAVAGEAKVPFFSISGSDFVEMFVGVGASRVRDLFKNAKEKAPCIIFIDEIDAIGRARGKNAFTGGNDERENTLNQLLTEMDGFGTNSGVIILAATNRAEILDKALMRAGRFDREIHVELPELEERKAIFNVHLKNIKKSPQLDIDFLAKQTPGFSGADIANVCNEAALIAARNGKKEVDKQDFLDAIDRIVGGLERRCKFISPEEKKTIAYHEAGHASVSWLLKHAHPLIKVTIVPRGKSLGAAWYLPEERQITTRDQMLDEMTATLGGRAAEDVVFGRISTGAMNDLEKVTKQAYAMVAYFGMSDKIGNISYYDSQGGQEYSFSKPYCEKTSEIIDTEVRDIVEAAYQKAKDILAENRDKLDTLADTLMKREVLFRDDLEQIFGPRPADAEKAIEDPVIDANVVEGNS
ncbi:MAG: ATP-dependent zinc metalloprotease FtsH [Bacteroidales bacterium]|nr:ATP-dependent zinc metalloprotease FtsH [Bacteroidales bacterium]